MGATKTKCMDAVEYELWYNNRYNKLMEKFNCGVAEDIQPKAICSVCGHWFNKHKSGRCPKGWKESTND